MNNESAQPLITVCVTSYNHKNYIRECIDSLLNQSHKNIEIIVIDDCSTDGTLEILRSYGDQISLTAREKNLGVIAHGQTINSVIRSAKGEYFYRIDSDDFIEPDYLGRLMNEVSADPKLDWICGGLNVVDSEGLVIDTWDYEGWPTETEKALAHGWQSCSVVMPHNGIFRTSFLRENELYFHHFPYGWGEDVLFTIRGMQFNPHVRLISKPGFNWRTHGNNNSCNIENRVKLVLAVKEYYLENIPIKSYLKHEILGTLAEGSDDHKAARDFLVAADLYNARMNFRVPTMFESKKTAQEVEKNLYLFDDEIRKYAERSLGHSRRFQNEVNELYNRLKSEELVVEGRHSLKIKDYRKASIQFTQAVDINNNSVSALTGLCESNFGLNDLEAAKRFSDRALSLNPNDSAALNNSGVLLHIRGKYAEAEQSFIKTLTSNSGNADSHMNLMQLYATVSTSTIILPHQRDNLISSATWLNRREPADGRDVLIQLNNKLRDAAFEQYADCYEGSNARILLHRPDNGALKFLMEGWSETLTLMGIPSQLLSWGEDTKTQFEQFKPTVFITVADPGFMGKIDIDFITKYRLEHDFKVGHVTTIEHKYEPVDFYITYHLDPEKDSRFAKLDRPLLSLPFGVHPLHNQMKSGANLWDYFFVGSNSYRKTSRTEAYLNPIVKNHTGILAGTNWNTGIGEIPMHQAAELYNFASIYPNYHLQEQIDSFNEVNERTFVIAACGGFQIVDNPAAISQLFAPDEIAVAQSPEEYHYMFEHFLANSDKRISFIEKGMKRVWKDYTLFSVLSRLAEFLGCKPKKASGTKSNIEHEIASAPTP